jgi:hypothetical protein
MAKRRKVLLARTRRDRSRDFDSALLRSAETLGRVIGVLQRQLDSATKRFSNSPGGAIERRPTDAEATTRRRQTTAKRRAVSPARVTPKTKHAKAGMPKQARRPKSAKGRKDKRR